jgi:ribosome-associated translation inhibitor RaiA
MARTKNKARRGGGIPESREEQRSQEGNQVNKESRKARRAKKRSHNDIEADNTGEVQSVKRAKTSPDSNGTGHVSSLESTNASTVNPEESSISQNKESQTAKPSNTLSSSAPPIYGDIVFTHDITQISILTSSKIEKRVTSVLEKLAQYPVKPPSKPVVVFLHSKAAAASKLITIVEIAKREIAAKGGKWFQYNALSQIMEEMSRDVKKGHRKSREPKDSLDVNGSEKSEDGEEEDSFEVMKTPFERAVEGTPKIRAIPVMATYLSRIRIESLRKKYG